MTLAYDEQRLSNQYDYHNIDSDVPDLSEGFSSGSSTDGSSPIRSEDENSVVRIQDDSYESCVLTDISNGSTHRKLQSSRTTQRSQSLKKTKAVAPRSRASSKSCSNRTDTASSTTRQEQICAELAIRSRSGNVQPRTSVSVQSLLNQPHPKPEEYSSPEKTPSPQAIRTAVTTNSSNSRRTQVENSAVLQTQSGAPPPLTRQHERANNFVESLVDTATQMIEVIWPISTISCDRDYLGGKNLIGLRTFIQEVLKRSKTSYYTLQVALFYLILIKGCLPKVECTSTSSELPHAQRAMQCGRRMFLAALILASKYLQDRNYSARAWSKISGLKVQEINSNEMAFLKAVNWNLHIPELKFQRWSNIVFKYSTSQSGPLPCVRWSTSRTTWRDIIPRLTSELKEDELEVVNSPIVDMIAAKSVTPSAYLSSREVSLSEGSRTPSSLLLSPTSNMKTPSLSLTWSPEAVQQSLLPAPQQSAQARVPAVRAANTWSHGQAMHEACLYAQEQSFKKLVSDPWPCPSLMHLPTTSSLAPRQPLNRVMSSGSLISSPESMVSDFTQSSCSTRSSRSSSISSVAPVVLGGAMSSAFSQGHRSCMASLNGPRFGQNTWNASTEDLYTDNAVNGSKADQEAILTLLNLRQATSLQPIPRESHVSCTLTPKKPRDWPEESSSYICSH